MAVDKRQGVHKSTTTLEENLYGIARLSSSDGLHEGSFYDGLLCFYVLVKCDTLYACVTSKLP